VRRDESFAVAGHVHVDIDVTAGSVLVRTAASGTVAVSVDTANASDFSIALMGDTVTVRAGRRSRSARVLVDCPAGTDVSVRGASLELAARGPLGSLRVRTASGDVEADDVVRLEASTASGDLRVGLVRSVLSGSVASGDLRIERVGGDIDFGSASGDVSIGRCDGSSIAIRSLSGDLRIGLPSGIRVDPEISTLSGRVVLPKPAGAARGDSAGAGERRSVRLRLRTVSGDIRVERADRPD
jgi:hypothetical protein